MYITHIVLLIFTLIFTYVGHVVYKDNYSIEALVNLFQLYASDELQFTIKINQSAETKKCTIEGSYKNSKLKINSIEDAHRNNKNCKEIINNTDLNFIGDFDDITTVSSDGYCDKNTNPCPSKAIEDVSEEIEAEEQEIEYELK